MVIDTQALLINVMDGKPLLSADGKTAVTLGSVCVEALLAMLEDDRKMSGAQKMKNWELAERIAKGGVVKASAEEVSLLKDRIGVMYGPAVVGPAFTLLDPPTTTPALKIDEGA